MNRSKCFCSPGLIFSANTSCNTIFHADLLKFPFTKLQDVLNFVVLNQIIACL